MRTIIYFPAIVIAITMSGCLDKQQGPSDKEALPGRIQQLVGNKLPLDTKTLNPETSDTWTRAEAKVATAITEIVTVTQNRQSALNPEEVRESISKINELASHVSLDGLTEFESNLLSQRLSKAKRDTILSLRNSVSQTDLSQSELIRERVKISILADQ